MSLRTPWVCALTFITSRADALSDGQADRTALPGLDGTGSWQIELAAPRERNRAVVLACKTAASRVHAAGSPLVASERVTATWAYSRQLTEHRLG
jgi:hypothetical protein